MRWDKLLFFLLAALCAGSPAFAQTDGAGPQSQRIFIVHSYNPEYIWCQSINQGVEDALRGKIKTDIFYLDAKRDHNPESLQHKADAILQRIEADRPQVVVAVDDAAQQLLVVPHLKGRGAPQVIFCGVNAPLKHYGYPAQNVSGVRERWHFRQGFSLLKLIVPKARRLVLITDDSESSSFVLADLAADRRKAGPFAMQVDTQIVDSFQQWQAQVLGAQSRAGALALGIYHSLHDERTGKIVPPETVNQWTTRANKLPTLGFADYVLEHGQLCGVIESGHEQGALAGGMARQVLERGAKAGSLGVLINQKGIVVLNLKTAERLGVAIPFALIQAAGVVIQ